MQTLNDIRRKARKHHRCMLCHRLIDPGEMYRYQVIVGDWGIYAWKNCEHCDLIASLVDQAFGWLDEGIHDGIVSEWEPETIPHLRLKVYWQQGWRKPDGTLRDLSVLEEQEK